MDFTYLNELYVQAPWIFYSSAIMFGLCCGSFLNVVIHRLPQMLNYDWHSQCLEFLAEQLQQLPEDQRRQCPLCEHQHPQPVQMPSLTQSKINLLFPRSRCPDCDHKIAWWDNVPLISFLLLNGRCRHCQRTISWRYPLVELCCGVLTPWLLCHLGLGLPLLGALLLSYTMIVIIMIDLDWQIIPDNLSMPLLWLGLLFNIGETYCTLSDAVIGAMVGYLLLWAVYQGFKLVTGKEGMGYGDFKLLAVFGAWLGWQMLPLVILIASVMGSLVGGLLMFLRGKSLPFAFGPYLALGGMIGFLSGEQIIIWYMGMF